MPYKYTNDTRNMLEGYFNGKEPLERKKPAFGESKNYFIDPNDSTQTIEVPDGTDPYAFRDAGYKSQSLTDIGSGLTTETGTGLNTSLTNNSSTSLTDQTGIGSNSLNTSAGLFGNKTSSNTPSLFGSTKTNTDNPWAALGDDTTTSTTSNPWAGLGDDTTTSVNSNPWAGLQDTIKLYNNTKNGASSNTSFSKNVPSNNWYDKSQDFTNGVYQGATLGFSDELNGLGHGLVYGLGDLMTGYKDGTFGGGFNRGYQYGRGKSRNENNVSQQRNGGLYLAGEVAGSAVNPNVGSKFLKHFSKRPLSFDGVLRSSTFGAENGAILGAGTSENSGLDLLQDISISSAIGGATGPLIPVASRGVQKIMPKSYDKYVNMALEKKQMQDSYNRLNSKPFSGRAEDIVAEFDPYGTERMVMRKGGVLSQNGSAQVPPKFPFNDIYNAGRPVGNMGMVKSMPYGKHPLTQEEFAALPEMMRSYNPVMENGTKVWRVLPEGQKYPYVFAANRVNNKPYSEILSFYKDEKNFDPAGNYLRNLSSKK